MARKPGQPHKGWKAAARQRHEPDAITVAQKIVRKWCRDNGVVLDVLIASDLVGSITTAIIKRS